MKPLLMLLALFVVTLMAHAPVCQAASRPVSPGVRILKEALDNYDHAKTIQGTVTIRLDQGGTLTKTTMTAQVINRPGGQVARERIGITTDSPAILGDVLGGGRYVYVYNGQTLYTLYPASKQFSAQPGADRFSNLFRNAVQRYLAAGGTATARFARMGDEAVIILTGKARGLAMSAVISHGDRVLRSITFTAPNKRYPVRITVTNLRLNEPLPSTLSWEPPADYTPLTVTHSKPNAELPDFSRVSPKPPGAVPAATAAEAREWLQKMFAAQQQLRSYTALGEKIEEVQGDPASAHRVSAEIKYALPNLISVVTTAPSERGVGHTVAACDGRWLSARIPSEPGRYLHIPAPPGRQAYAQACAVFVTEDNFFSPGLGLEMMLRGESPLAFLTEAAGSFSMGPDGSVDGLPVKTVSVTLAVTASGEPFQSATYLIGRDDFLLRRLVWKEKLTGDRTHVVTQTFTHLRINPDLPASAFAFTPLPHAKAVTSLP